MASLLPLEFLELLRCPDTGSALSQDAKAPHALKSIQGKSYPLIHDIPWIYHDTNATVLEWKLRIQRVLEDLQQEKESLRQQSKAKDLPEKTAIRINRLLKGKSEQRSHLEKLLIDILQIPNKNTAQLAEFFSPKQHIQSYFNNVFRDWAWGENENLASLNLLQPLLSKKPLGKTLILGSGASRLAYDIHQKFNPSLTLCLDINPLLLLTAQKICHGHSLQLYEFPVTPLHPEDAAVMHTLSLGKKPKPEHFYFIFADALDPALAAGVFDTVITPWFIDIIPMHTAELASNINYYLKNGGQWINFGALGFSHSLQTYRYTADELSDVICPQGFSDFKVQQAQIDYLASPYSSYRRLERVSFFSADKTNEVERIENLPGLGVLPDWIQDPDLPIPIRIEIQTFAETQKILSDLTLQIDGKKSLNDLVNFLNQSYGIAPDEAKQSITSLLLKLNKDLELRSSAERT